jgi:CxxC motif-containing protein
MESKITCIICPIGCEVTILHKEGIITNMEGHQCKKGIEYVKEELFDPKRTLTTTMIVRDGELPLVSVKTNRPIPKDRLFEVMDCISEIEIDAPLEIGDVLVESVLGLDADIVATKKVDREKGKINRSHIK